MDGCLDLRDFASLQELDCSKNQLIELDLTNCVQLEKVDCSGNCLQDLKLPSQIEQLTELSIRGNNFDRNIYDCLRDLVESKNLKRLDVVIIDRKVNNQLEASTSKYNDDQEEESYEEVDAQEYLNKKYPEGKRS